MTEYDKRTARVLLLFDDKPKFAEIICHYRLDTYEEQYEEELQREHLLDANINNICELYKFIDACYKNNAMKPWRYGDVLNIVKKLISSTIIPLDEIDFDKYENEIIPTSMQCNTYMARIWYDVMFPSKGDINNANLWITGVKIMKVVKFYEEAIVGAEDIAIYGLGVIAPIE